MLVEPETIPGSPLSVGDMGGAMAPDRRLQPSLSASPIQYQAGQYHAEGIIENDPFSPGFGVGSSHCLVLGLIAVNIRIKLLRIVNGIC